MSRALEEIEKLLKQEPENRDYRTTHATIGERRPRRLRSAPSQLYRELLAETPQAAELHLSMAHALKTSGPRGRRRWSRTVRRRRPGRVYGDAYWSLANLKTYRFTEEEIAQCAPKKRAAGTALVDRYHLCFALGKALEDRGEYAESFGYYERGNALKKARDAAIGPSPPSATRACSKQLCTREFFAARRGVGCDSPAPIFIVGLPRVRLDAARADSRLALAGRRHDGAGGYPAPGAGVAGARVDDDAPTLPGRARGPAQHADFARLGEKYLADTRVYRTGKPRLHRQDAQQLPAPRPHPSDAAQCQDHRCAARAHGLLLQQLQAAVRLGAGVHLQPRGHRPLLPQLRRR